MPENHATPVVEPSRTKPLLRGDTTPPVPIITEPVSEEPWDFSPAQQELLWRGEGPRCEATFPPTAPDRSVQCELVGGHSVPHSAQRSSV